jgi:hypothetical protein
MRLKSIIAVVISVIIAFLFIGIYKWDNSKMERLDLKQISEESTENISIKVENIDYGDKYIKVTGWAIEKGTVHEYFNWVTGEDKSVYNNNKVVLQNEESELLGLNTVSTERKDVSDAANDGIDYKRCGVEAVIDRNKIKMGEVYKIGILVTTLDGEKKLVMSNEEIRL